MSDRDPAEAGVIVATPGVVGGKPRLAGTRIYTTLVYGPHRDGYSMEQILRMWPDLDRFDVMAAIGFEIGREYERRKRKRGGFVALPLEG